jgi:hypothetical protein
MSYVSPSLPAIPDGRISQVRFWPRPWRISKQEPSRETRDLNTGLHTPQRVPVYSCSCHGSMSTACIQLCVWVPSRSMAAECPEPLCQVQVLPAPGCLHETPRRALPLLHRSYGLMRQTNLLPSYSVPLLDGSSQVVTSPCWMLALPDVVSACLSLDAWPHTPASPRCLCPFLPRGLRPSPRFDGVGSPAPSVGRSFFMMIFLTRPICIGLLCFVGVILAGSIYSTFKNKRGMLASDAEA